MASLFSAVAGYSGRPTNAQLANVKMIEDQFAAAKMKLEAIKNKFPDLNQSLAKAKLPTLKVRTWGEFKAIE